jgi:predicted NAD/FAD-binding protein
MARQLRIAVIGSGIAGLAAAWALKRCHHVTLFERHSALGMDAFAVDVPGASGSQRVDVPMRVVYEAYYPNISSLYREAAIELEALEYSGTFSHLGGATYLSYRNFRMGGYALPMLRGLRALRGETVPIIVDALRFFATVAADLRRGMATGRTLEEYLRLRNYSRAFIDSFLVPTLAGICTCTYSAVRACPAGVVLDYFARGLFFVPVKRARRGIADVVARLSAGVQQTRLGAGVENVAASADDVTVRVRGVDERFDHVVIAAQANHALRMLQCTPAETAALSSFSYQPSTVLMHSDVRLAPSNRTLWGPVNFILSAEHTMPMATIWMNTVHAGLGNRDVFQTWNPVIEPDPALVYCRIPVERPVVNEQSICGLALLDALHAQNGRRVWFAGAYASPGVPLLESAATSGLAMAAKIGALAA